ncbi:unnamed protein product, partial [Polarella glacialis]
LAGAHPPSIAASSSTSDLKAVAPARAKVVLPLDETLIRQEESHGKDQPRDNEKEEKVEQEDEKEAKQVECDDEVHLVADEETGAEAGGRKRAGGRGRGPGRGPGRKRGRGRGADEAKEEETAIVASEDMRGEGGLEGTQAPLKRKRVLRRPDTEPCGDRPVRQKKAAKDPEAPKKPVGGAYGIFLADNREAIKKSLPAEAKITDVAKEAGKQWKELSEEAKKPFQDRYLEKSEVYKKASEEYKQTHVADKSARPKLPLYAFELFQRQAKSTDEKDLDLFMLVEEWKMLSDEARAVFVQMAEEDSQRFESEYEPWCLKRSELGKKEMPLKELIDRRRAALERKLASVDRVSGVKRKIGRACERKATTRQVRTRKDKAPEGFPEEPLRSAYSIFCKESSGVIRAAVATKPSELEPGEKEGKQRGGMLVALRQGWQALSSEERASYESRVAQDEERFRAELEVWSEAQTDGGLGIAAYQAAVARRSSSTSGKERRLAKPRLLPAEQRNLKPRGELGDILFGATGLLDEEMKSRRKATVAAEQSQAEARGAWSGGPADSQLPLKPKDTSASVDDLLGDLCMVEESNLGDGTDHDADFGELDEAPPEIDSWTETPQASGAPRALGPQLCLDEAGNIVLNQSSLSKNLADEYDPMEDGGPVQEAVSQYQNSYKKTPAAKWSEEETLMFYEALGLYGTDLFLVQTFFRNKSAAQVKTKFGKEIKKNPQQVAEA